VTALDPQSLSLDELRAMRNALQAEDDVVSYVRRVAQARVDLVRAERLRRERGERPEDYTILSLQEQTDVVSLN